LNTAVQQEQLKGKSIGIIGGGITGLTAAFRLLKAGARVTVLEAGAQPGGLATSFDFGPFWWDKFYHCILTSDSSLLGLIDELGLTGELRWTETKTGFFANGKLHSMSSVLEFLRFEPLTLWQKVRLGFGILYAARIRDGKPLEKVLASEWLIKIFGRANYEKMWGPMLKCKLGGCREETSAAFIWTYISRYYSTREKNTSQKEKLGYVAGGYRVVFERLISEIERLGGRMELNASAQRIYSRHQDNSVAVKTSHGEFVFDRVLATIPNRPFTQATEGLDPAHEEKLKQIKYLGVLCFVLLLKRKLSPYYVLNLTDESLPFTGVIEMTNLVSTQESAGYHLIYLPKYTVPGDPLFESSEEELWNVFRLGIAKIFPDLQDSDIEARFLFRERLVQPVPVLNYSDIVPSMRTNIDGLYLANTTQIINSNLNNNAMVKIADRAVQLVIEDCINSRPAVISLPATTTFSAPKFQDSPTA
jgi:protoporphyrinogen oxidase